MNIGPSVKDGRQQETSSNSPIEEDVFKTTQTKQTKQTTQTTSHTDPDPAVVEEELMFHLE
jgi:hypothetical protein